MPVVTFFYASKTKSIIWVISPKIEIGFHLAILPIFVPYKI